MAKVPIPPDCMYPHAQKLDFHCWVLSCVCSTMRRARTCPVCQRREEERERERENKKQHKLRCLDGPGKCGKWLVGASFGFSCLKPRKAWRSATEGLYNHIHRLEAVFRAVLPLVQFCTQHHPTHCGFRLQCGFACALAVRAADPPCSADSYRRQICSRFISIKLAANTGPTIVVYCSRP
jgi:hypothetical protein